MEPLTHEQWVREEGGIEHPTHLETLSQPCQIKRINWLKDNAVGDVLELGCNWGFVLNHVAKRGHGVDINYENIEKARKEFPWLAWSVGDVTKEVLFPNNSFDTVMLPDMLEHISKEKVNFVLDEAARISRYTMLVTLPKSEKKRHCFKHCWLVDDMDVFNIADHLRNYFMYVYCHSDEDFFYIRARSKK